MGNAAQGFEFSDWRLQRPGAGRSFFVSLTIHAAVVALAWNINPRPVARSFPEPRLAEFLDPDAHRLVWYEPRQEMPAIAPAEQPAPQISEPEQARFELPQRVTASDPNPDSLQSMVRTDLPEVELPPDVQLPNMISWKAPEVERPRYQATESTLVAPSTEGLPALEPPRIETAVQTELSAAELQQIARRRFQQQQQELRQTPQQQALEAEILALEVQAQTSPLDAAQFQQLTRLRYQVQQQHRANPASEALPGEAAPDIRAQGAVAVDAAELQQLSRLRYQSGNERPEAAPQRTALDANAPQLSAAPVPSGVALDAAQFQELARLRYQAGREAEARNAPAKRALADAVGGQPAQIEQLADASSNAGVDVSPLQKLSRLRYREAGGDVGSQRAAGPTTQALGEVAGGAAPTIGGLAAPASGVPFGSAIDLPSTPPASLGGAGGDRSGGTGGDINLVAVGVKPADSLPENVPAGSRRGAFTAGPETGEGRGATGAGAPVRVPNLAIDRSSRTDSQPAGAGGNGNDLLSSLTRRNSIRDGQAPSPDIDIVYNEKPIDIDNPFVGRPVYTMAVNMPNVTSYRGDWVLQFAELTETVESESDAEMEQRLASANNELTPPFPVIKVDPKYVASAVREQIQGIVVFYAVISDDGILSKLRLVRGVDERLDAAAGEALKKWEFRAAMKNGKAVAVESLIRIPFRLDPSIKMRY
jgi:hypothetical protein